MVAVHAVLGTGEFVLKRFRVRRRGIGVRHFENSRHAPHDGRAGARFQILLVLHTRLAEMHLAVDHARQQMEPRAIDHLARLVFAYRANCRDPSAADPYIALTDPVLINYCSAFENEIECF